MRCVQPTQLDQNANVGYLRRFYKHVTLAVSLLRVTSTICRTPSENKNRDCRDEEKGRLCNIENSHSR
jgi:hypothetical protein